MNKINCSVDNCSHNNSGTCYANRVDIGGGLSNSACSTCCASFLDERNYSNLTNNTNSGGNCDCLVCTVEGCAYNENKSCTLDSINITGNEVKVYSNTECASFEKA